MLAPADIIRLEDDRVVLLDQTRLPAERSDRVCTDVEGLVDAIRCLAIRGAPALGIAGAMGMALAARRGPDDVGALRATVVAAGVRLAGARPTAVNLGWAVEGALAVADGAGDDADGIREALADHARALHAAEVDRCRRMGAHGAALVGDGPRILTQCNAGALACGGYGSALGVVRALHDAGRRPHVWVPETRPLLQGARLTAWECAEEGIDHVLVTDGAVASLFAGGAVDAVVVGADRIARNGDVANKVGTYGLAVLARHHGVPLYVVAPTSTIDPATADGAGIPIEERDGWEVRRLAGVLTAPAATPCHNPAFDVTPADLVTAIVTERGVHRPPYAFGAALSGP